MPGLTNDELLQGILKLVRDNGSQTLGVLEERLTNLVGRVTIGFEESKAAVSELHQETIANRLETGNVKDELRQQNSSIKKLFEKQGLHEAEDKEIHEAVMRHISDHDRQVALSRGRAEALGLLDRLLLRGLALGASALALYEASQRIAK